MITPKSPCAVPARGLIADLASGLPRTGVFDRIVGGAG